MKKICFIAQFPPPMHGLSKAVETLYNSNLNFEIDSQGEFEFEKVDITNNKNFIKNLLKISRISTPTCVNETACEKDTVAFQSTGTLNRVAPTPSLWSLQWCHFYAPSLPAIYEKYKERGGSPVFHPDDSAPFTTILTDLYSLASTSDYIRDMRINESLSALLTLLMEQSWHPESKTVSRKRLELVEIKNCK